MTVTFDIGTDLNTAVVKVQNRVALAMPQLPTEVQNQGITIRKKTPDILMIVNFFSHRGRKAATTTSTSATTPRSTSATSCCGCPGCRTSPTKASATTASAAGSIRRRWRPATLRPCDVASAIRNQNLDAPAGWIGAACSSASSQAFELPIDTLGRLNTPEQFGDIIVKAGMSAPPPSPRTAMAPPQGNFGLPERRVLRWRSVCRRRPAAARPAVPRSAPPR